MLLATTTVTIRRPDGDGDPYETATAPTVARGVDAHISAPSGRESNVGGAGERIDAVGLLPSCTDVQRADRLVDDCTGVEYRVASVVERTGLGLDHLRCPLVAVDGGASG